VESDLTGRQGQKELPILMSHFPITPARLLISLYKPEARDKRKPVYVALTDQSPRAEGD
jgi:hypothetical protein